MALWERLFAAIPQILDDYFPSETHHYGTFRRRDPSADDKHIDRSLQSESVQQQPSPLTTESLRDNMHNSQAIAMYHRAMTLQRGNSENMNQHIFAPPLLGPSGCSHNNNNNSYSPSDFEEDDDDEDCYSVSSGDSVSSPRSESGESAQSVLSEEEYLDFHYRMNLDELSSLYEESEDEHIQSEHNPLSLEMVHLHDQPSWVEMRRGPLDGDGATIYEVTVRPESGRLNEEDWKTLLDLLAGNGMERISLSLCNVVLDQAASHWLCRLNGDGDGVSDHDQRVRLQALNVENGYFAHRSSKEEDFVDLNFVEKEGNEGGGGMVAMQSLNVEG